MGISKLLFLFVVLSILPTTVIANTLQPCGNTSTKTGKYYKVNGSEIVVREGPSENHKKIINKKATQILKRTFYIHIDGSVTIYEECRQGEWSKVRVTDPDSLSDSHIGWVKSKVLREKIIDSSGDEVFTEEDFYFDENTSPYKQTIIKWVNKIHKEKAYCYYIDTFSAYISDKGTKKEPIFFVTCGKGIHSVNVFFSKKGIEK